MAASPVGIEGNIAPAIHRGLPVLLADMISSHEAIRSPGRPADGSWILFCEVPIINNTVCSSMLQRRSRGRFVYERKDWL